MFGTTERMSQHGITLLSQIRPCGDSSKDISTIAASNIVPGTLSQIQ
jgi:hypothetical protein